MKVTLTHDGKSVELDLTAEQMTALGLKEEKKKTGYERIDRNKQYVYLTSNDTAIRTYDNNNRMDIEHYDAANYYSDDDLAIANARADRLMRQLRRFAAENGGIPSVEDWEYNGRNKFLIRYDYTCEELFYSIWTAKRWAGAVYFNSSDACVKAIEKFHDELIWYFTEYEAMLR